MRGCSFRGSRSRLRGPRARAALGVVLGLVLASTAVACRPSESGRPGRTAGSDDSGGPGTSSSSGETQDPVRCQAPRALPGGPELLPSTIAAIEGTDIPSAALLRTRRTCNRLVLEPGLFAAQHALDPIDWRPWSPRVLAEAERLGRPLLVLTGYSACRECGRLTSGPLSKPRLVRRINRSFVPVLLDREERPDVDAYLMQAVQVLTAGGGWPSLVFLLSDGRPFAAQTWGAARPPEADRAGDPDESGRRRSDSPAKGIDYVLRRLRFGGGGLEDRAGRVAERMQRRASLDTKGPVPDAAATSLALRGYLMEAFDGEDGTFGSGPYFPRPPVLDFLLARARLGDREALGMAERSLEELRYSALADPDGGFRRYARGKGWADPASERMLADNATLARSYLDAADITGRADFLETGRATVDFLLETLGLEQGAFAASVDRREGAGENGFLRDDRVLADANALAVSALLRASEVLEDHRYRDAAIAAGRFLDTRLRDSGRVNHCSYQGGGRCADGYLSDQALTALAFLDLDEAGAPGGGRWLDAARTIADAMPDAFGDQGSGGFYRTSTSAEPLLLRDRPALDSAVPCGNSAAAWLYVRLAERARRASVRAQADRGDEGTGDAGDDADAAPALWGDAGEDRGRRYEDEARRVFEGFAKVLELRPLALPSMVSALERSRAPEQLEPAPAVQP